MACGTPAIAGRTLDAVDFVKNEALLVNPEDPAEIADAIVRLLSEPDLYERLSVLGLAKAKQHSWAANAAQTLDLYRKLL